jgi:hypothetical protein
MDWEIVLFLVLGMPFALVNWTVSGLRRLAKAVTGRGVHCTWTASIRSCLPSLSAMKRRHRNA